MGSVNSLLVSFWSGQAIANFQDKTDMLRLSLNVPNGMLQAANTMVNLMAAILLISSADPTP